jgi:hypothetical protein
MPGAQVTLRRSGGGVFEITIDGKLAYSKKASGRFPTDAEVLATLGLMSSSDFGLLQLEAAPMRLPDRGIRRQAPI